LQGKHPKKPLGTQSTLNELSEVGETDSGAARPETHPDFYQLAFAVNRSLRYHSLRRAFFERLHNFAMFLTTIGGSGVVVSAFADAGLGPQGFGVVVAVAAGLDRAFNFSRKASLHSSLYQRFSDLAAKLDGAKNVSDADIRSWKAERRRIEKDEPAVIDVLNIMCRNAEFVSRGRSDRAVSLRGYQRFFAQLGSLPPKSWEKNEGGTGNGAEKEKNVG
jgi:hypothetical protein